jgi:hypothetical protein
MSLALDHNTLVIISYLAIMLVVGAIGEMVQKLIAAKGGDQGWRGVYYVTKAYHPIFVCAAVFAIVVDVPLFDGVSSTITNRVISGAGLGALTMVAYELTVKTIRKFIITFGDRMGGFFADWAHRLGGSSNTPTRRSNVETRDGDLEEGSC